MAERERFLEQAEGLIVGAKRIAQVELENPSYGLKPGENDMYAYTKLKNGDKITFKSVDDTGELIPGMLYTSLVIPLHWYSGNKSAPSSFGMAFYPNHVEQLLNNDDLEWATLFESACFTAAKDIAEKVCAFISASRLIEFCDFDEVLIGSCVAHPVGSSHPPQKNDSSIVKLKEYCQATHKLKLPKGMELTFSPTQPFTTEPERQKEHEQNFGPELDDE